jgi:hypothetical protein
LFDADPSLSENLFALLPECDRSPHGLRAFLSSPQFQQATQALSQAVRGGHLQNILRQMGVEHPVQDPSPIVSLIKSLEKTFKK